LVDNNSKDCFLDDDKPNPHKVAAPIETQFLILHRSDDKYFYFLIDKDKSEGMITHMNFEVARKMEGTDQDLIFLFGSIED